MKSLRSVSAVLRTIVVMALAMLLTSGCESVQPMIDASAAWGVASGVITPDQATSISRSSQAVGKTFQDITPEQEYYIGRSVAATVLSRYRPYTDESANHYLNLVGQSLAQASDRPETFGGYHFLLIDSPEINAFAAPGGFILVSRGLLRCCTSEDALAAVLAHEIGHVQGKHGLRAIQTGRLSSALTLLAGEGLKNFGGEELGRLTEAFEGSVGDIVQTMMNSGYSRALEREADQAAVQMLRRVGYDPHALVDMLIVMDSRLEPGRMDFAKTHPDPKDRIREIEPLVRTSLSAPAPQKRQNRFERAVGRI